MEAAEYHCSLSNPDKPSRPPKCRHNTHYTDSGKSVLRYLPFQTQHKPYNARQLRAGQSSITSPSRQNTNHTTQGNRGLGKPALLPLPERLQTTQHKATESWAKQHYLPFQTRHKPHNTRQQRVGQSSITSLSRQDTNHATQGNRELGKAALPPLPDTTQTTQHKATESWAKQHYLPFQTQHKPRNTRQQRAGQSSSVRISLYSSRCQPTRRQTECFNIWFKQNFIHSS